MEGSTPEPELLERSLLSRARLWYESLQQQSRLVVRDVPEPGHSRTRTRLRSLRPIREPVFVLGCPRSGTTYLGSLLAQLQDSTYLYEPQILKYYVRLVRGEQVGRLHASLLYRLGLHSLVLWGPGHGPRPIEKNPNHVFAVDYLASIFPDARFIIITRDGRDVAVSLSEKPWHRGDAIGTGREPGGYRNGPFPHFYIEEERAEEYRATSDIHRAIWIWRQHQEEVERLRARTDIFSHHVRYEDLVESPSDTVGALCDFLDASPESRAEVLRHSSTGHSSSVGRWQEALSDDDLLVIDHEAGALLRQLGYG